LFLGGNHAAGDRSKRGGVTRLLLGKKTAAEVLTRRPV